MKKVCQSIGNKLKSQSFSWSGWGRNKACPILREMAMEAGISPLPWLKVVIRPESSRRAE